MNKNLLTKSGLGFGNKTGGLLPDLLLVSVEFKDLTLSTSSFERADELTEVTVVAEPEVCPLIISLPFPVFLSDSVSMGIVSTTLSLFSGAKFDGLNLNRFLLGVSLAEANLIDPVSEFGVALLVVVALKPTNEVGIDTIELKIFLSTAPFFVTAVVDATVVDATVVAELVELTVVLT